MRMTEMIDKLMEILKEKEGQRVIVRGRTYLVENGYVIENYGCDKKLMPMKMTKGELEEFLEFLED